MALILFLHGASSSGKSTLAAEIRKQAGRPFLHLSIDHLRDSGAWDAKTYPDWPSARPAFFSGFHRAIAGFADAGNDLIVEHILDTPGWHGELQKLLRPHEVLFVGLHTALGTLNARETRRGDRPKGSAARDHDSVHHGLSYDLVLDGAAAPTQNAAEVLSCFHKASPSSNFFAS
ncbi:chloramphenicol phosphotransferase CPT family protein [Phaeobacter sp. HF9A]|uniref:chloramphenicol phosphotransferase CPT family protein n=1 Tax=Phaeobacter sp. HF9A TaxID=2721561 RepID=UPI00142FB922|nr:AAA family ATPase [Phaeobacter sp. HF9A]NIZ13479.1 AAA family ATPase [Phaeobacter sp. HF9A]